MSHPLSSWRAEFPIVNSKTYLASHSLGAVPQGTEASLALYYRLWAEKGIEAWDGPWWDAIDEFTGNIESILGAPRGTVVPFQNVTRAMAAVASCLSFDGPRNRVLLTDLEFTTSYPFWCRLESLGAEIVIVSSDNGIDVPAEKMIEALDDRVLIVPTSHAFFRSGALQDLKAISNAAHEVGAWVLGDGYQAVGNVPIDLVELDVDFYVGGCHKWLCGGAGAGYLYVKEHLISVLEPRLTGWFGLADPFEYRAATSAGKYNQGVWRFLGGTPNVPALYAASEGLKIVRSIGVEAIREVSSILTTLLLEGALSRGFELRSPTEFARRNGMVCFDFPEAEEAVSRLSSQNVIVDWRADCGIRVSPHFYNTVDDIERFYKVLDQGI